MNFRQDQSELEPDLSQQGRVQTLLCLRDLLVENRDAQLAAHAEGVSVNAACPRLRVWVDVK